MRQRALLGPTARVEITVPDPVCAAARKGLVSARKSLTRATRRVSRAC